ncbi:MAG: hypothetical protein KIG16_01350 [Eubacteriales bacterium]|nr:hypothetical protein [Eubacteriales bacterium]
MENQNETQNIKNLRNIMDNFSQRAKKGLKKTAQAVALTGLIVTGSTMAQSCTPLTNVPTAMEHEVADQTTPYDTQIGVTMATYTFHNFIGKKPDIISATAEDDLGRYVDQATPYLQNKFDSFTATLVGRPYLQRYFARFNLDFSQVPTHHHRETTNMEKLDYYTTRISDACAPVFADMVEFSDNAEHRQALILIMRTLTNEARKASTAQNADLTAYQTERAVIEAQWSQNSFLKSVDFDQDIDQNKCRGITQKLYTLHYEINKNMERDTVLADMKATDLQNMTNLYFLGVGLEAAHDYTADYTKHAHCNKTIAVIKTMQDTDDLLKARANDTEMGL